MLNWIRRIFLENRSNRARQKRDRLIGEVLMKEVEVNSLENKRARLKRAVKRNEN